MIKFYPAFLIVLATCFDQWLIYFHIGPYPPRNYITLLMLAHVAKKILINQFPQPTFKNRLKSQLFIIAVIVCWSYFSMLVRGDLKVSVLLIPIRTLILPIATQLYIVAHVRSPSDFNKYLVLLSSCITLSAVVGVLQFFDVQFAWDIRFFFMEHDSSYDKRDLTKILLEKGRICGLTLYSVNFAYQIVCAPPIFFALLASKWKGSRQAKVFLFAAFFITLFALFFSLVRSAANGVCLGIASIVLMSRTMSKNTKMLLIILSLLSATTVLYWQNSKQSDYLSGEQSVHPGAYSVVKKRMINYSDVSALLRFPAAIVALFVSLQHPVFGIRYGSYHQEAVSAAASIQRWHIPDYALKIAPHNSLINIMLNNGIPGLLLVFMFFFYLRKYLVNLSRKSDNIFQQALVDGFMGGGIAYLVHILFHNANIFAMESYNWYTVGVAWILINNTIRRKTPLQEFPADASLPVRPVFPAGCPS